jgi:hypothetical protein
MKRLLMILFCLTMTSGFCQEKEKPVKITGKNMDVKSFLKYLRYPRVVESWMKMKGTIINFSKAGKSKLPIEVRGRFRMASWRMQILVNANERWFVRQNFEDGQFGTSKIQQKAPVAGEKSLADMMIRPEDITLSFLYWKFVKEEKAESVSRQHCRVLRLKHQTADEEVLIWASSKYFFPMKVQWFRKGEKENYRELLFRGIAAFKPKSRPDLKFNVIDEVKISGKGWKTQLKFDKPKGDAVTDEVPPPADLFIRDKVELEVEAKPEKVEAKE